MSMIIDNAYRTGGAYQNMQTTQTEQKKEVAIEKQSVENSPKEIVPNMDMVIISAAGKKANAEMNSSSQNTNAETMEQTTSSVEEVQNTTNSEIIQQLESEDDEETSTGDLSQYTETELQQMYLKGEITKSEYEDELAERNG